MTNPNRTTALAKLAQVHEIDRADQNTAGEDLAAYLDDPGSIHNWVAVTRSPQTGVTYLKADFPDAAAAKGYAASNVDDDLFEELPVEVVNLDSGEARRCQLVARWPEEDAGAAETDGR